MEGNPCLSVSREARIGVIGGSGFVGGDRPQNTQNGLRPSQNTQNVLGDVGARHSVCSVCREAASVCSVVKMEGRRSCATRRGGAGTSRAGPPWGGVRMPHAGSSGVDAGGSQLVATERSTDTMNCVPPVWGAQNPSREVPPSLSCLYHRFHRYGLRETQIGTDGIRVYLCLAKRGSVLSVVLASWGEIDHRTHRTACGRHRTHRTCWEM